MFTQQDYNCIDRDYFDVFELEPLYVRIRSKNTGHFWRIYCAGVNGVKYQLVQHAHRYFDGFHTQNIRKKTLSATLNQIKKHDTFQINVRKHTENYWDDFQSVAI